MHALGNRSARAAFFCYHSVAAGGWPYLSVSPETFERHLATLQRRGWTTGDEQALERLASGRAVERPTAFLTFDDGYLDNYREAFPLLRRYGCRAFVFVLPDFLDSGAPLVWRGVEDAAADCPHVMLPMTWEMAGELAEHGNVIGSHTNCHRSLLELDDEALREELLDSRRRIAERLGRCETLAYPYGDEDARVRAAARDAGYRWAFTLPRGRPRGVEPIAIPRVAVDHRDGPRRFALKLHPLTRRVVHSDARVAVQTAARATLRRAAAATRTRRAAEHVADVEYVADVLGDPAARDGRDDA